MMYPYMILADHTEIVHSQLIRDGDIFRVEIHFERPTEDGFHTARCTLPDYTWLIRDGYTEQEIHFFEEWLRHNAHLIYKFAESGGVSCA